MHNKFCISILQNSTEKNFHTKTTYFPLNMEQLPKRMKTHLKSEHFHWSLCCPYFTGFAASFEFTNLLAQVVTCQDPCHCHSRQSAH